MQNKNKNDEFAKFTNGRYNDGDYRDIAYSFAMGFTIREARNFYGEELLSFYRKFKTNEWEGDLI